MGLEKGQALYESNDAASGPATINIPIENYLKESHKTSDQSNNLWVCWEFM